MTQAPGEWTNSSVRLIGSTDPMEFVVSRARTLTLEAREAGWSGPPFDPIELAHQLGLEVVPRDEIADARIVPLEGERLRIEYNPNRPRGRVRYSIAHEIVHTFFPDCAQKVRNREQKSAMSGDDWQLEMLCNIGAAELIMPIGSFPDLREAELSIDVVMDLRKKYDVSTEAVLLRFIKLTNKDCCLFAASMVESGPYAGRYRIDYAVPSKTWHRSLPGMHLSDSTILHDCTAIGFTAKGMDVWPPDGQPTRIECVGVPGYPGSIHARILGLAIAGDPTSSPTAIKYVVGDATAPRSRGAGIVVQVMNNSSASWAAGFSRALARKYSAAQVDYRKWFQDEKNRTMGSVHFFGEPAGITIATIVAQAGFGPSESPRIRYPALQRGLETVAEQAAKTGAEVHMPRIGCGIAGGTWAVVAELVEQAVAKRGVAVTVYDLPS